MAGMPFLPYGRHCIDDDDVEVVTRVLRGGALTCGPMVDRFEQAFARRVGAPHAVACANGTAGLHMAALALGLGPGDAVVVPTLTFLATANAVRFVGAEVVFADVDSDSGLMTAAHLQEALDRAGGRAKAVFPVHLNGQPADMDAIGKLARAHGLAVVEDACHALGTVAPDGSQAGDCRHADMTVFSLHPVKAVAMGEGGVVTCRTPDLDRKLRLLRGHGMVRDADCFLDPDQGIDADGSANPWYYEMQCLGFNYRASDIHCALGFSQLGKLDHFLDRRRELVTVYDRLLAGLPMVRPVAKVTGARPGWHLYAVLVDFEAAGRARAQVMRALAARGIGTQVHYLPVHRQPYYVAHQGRLSLPGADCYYRRVLTLPLHVGMTVSDVERVVDALHTVMTDTTLAAGADTPSPPAVNARR